MSVFENILVPTDFGDASRRAEEVAGDLASFFGARITLLHVWTLPTSAYAESIRLPLDRIELEAGLALEDAAGRLRAKHEQVRKLLLPGEPWRRIVEAAHDGEHDLVVIGTHGRQGVPRLFLGSVAEKVVRMSEIPVLTVHARAPT